MRCEACSRAARGRRSGRSPKRSCHRLLLEPRLCNRSVARQEDRLVALQTAVAKRQHAAREGGDIRLVRDEDDRDALAVQLLEEDGGLDTGPRVEGPGRPGGQQYGGGVGEGPGGGGPALRAA